MPHDSARPGPLDHAVLVVGGGPTGAMLAAELTLAGVDVLLVERRATADLDGSRAGGLHARTIEVLDQRGVAGRFLAEGKAMQVAGFAMIPLDVSDFPTRHPYGLALWQDRIERLLTAWVDELRVPSLRGVDVVDLVADAAGVDVALSDGRTLRAGWVVGCDGGRSTVRKKAGIAFEGWDASMTFLVAEARVTEPALGMRSDDRGIYGMGPLADGKGVRMVLREDEVREGEATTDELKRALVALYGTDFDVRPTWVSRFGDASRQAVAYRKGRVLVAGDAAHVHAPNGGQGLNLGVQDAVNLGWKLAQVARGVSPEVLLDTYHAERHPIGARVLQLTMAQVPLGRGDARTQALRAVLADLLAMDEGRKTYAGLMSGLGLRYALGEGHPLVGRRVPDLDLDRGADAGPRRVYELLHDARWLLLDFGAGGPDDLAARTWGAEPLRVAARAPGPWALPVVGDVPAPGAVLVRPDGYVAWAAPAAGG